MATRDKPDKVTNLPATTSVQADWTSSARPTSRYSTLARALAADIQAEKYRVGDRIPTEEQLERTFGVSRHTVRAALRELKTQGMLASHPGIGTVVRAKPARARFIHGVSSMDELLQLVEATRLKVVSQQDIVADDVWAARLACKPGQQWKEVSLMRTVRKEPLPIAFLKVYIRPEHVDVIAQIDESPHPIIHLIERNHGVHITEVAQDIIAVALDAAEAKLLLATKGTPALQITRHYRDAQDRVIMLSVGRYPSDRFNHSTKFRVERTSAG